MRKQLFLLYRDYRMGAYPGRNVNVRHPNDASIQTLRGHSVMGTLIRAYWSPMHTTGQRFVYTGSADGRVHIFGEFLILKSKLPISLNKLP